MSKLILENCEQINISTIVRKLKEEIFLQKPVISIGEFELFLDKKLAEVSALSLKHKSPLRIIITHTIPNYGGKRYWFICPGCKRRVGVLYKPEHGDIFKCRDCYNLIYQSSATHDNREKQVRNILLESPQYMDYLWAKRPRLMAKIYKKRYAYPSLYLIRGSIWRKTYEKYVY